MKQYFEPWLKTLTYIKTRIKYHPDYNGERRQIKNFLTIGDLKKLWFRDKACLMEKPSINRRNSKQNYTFSNCQYMELRENQKQAKNIYARHKNFRLKNKWALHHEKCKICGTTDKKHAGKGLCKFCYEKYWWKIKNPNYHRDFLRRWRNAKALL